MRIGDADYFDVLECSQRSGAMARQVRVGGGGSRRVDAPLADWAMGTPGTDAGRVGRIGECVVYGCAESGAGDVEQIMVVAGEDLVSQD